MAFAEIGVPPSCFLGCWFGGVDDLSIKSPRGGRGCEGGASDSMLKGAAHYVPTRDKRAIYRKRRLNTWIVLFKNSMSVE